jgi:hypothetical protein
MLSNPPMATQETDVNPRKRQPVSLVHIDQTTGARFARAAISDYQLWRPILHAALDCSLALHDFRSMEVKDLIPITLVYPDREGDTYCVKFDEAHEWKYMRGMEPDGFVLVKWHAIFLFPLIKRKF